MGSLETLFYVLAVAGFLAFNALVRRLRAREQQAQEARGAGATSTTDDMQFDSEEVVEFSTPRARSVPSPVPVQDGVRTLPGKAPERVPDGAAQRDQGPPGETRAPVKDPVWRELREDPASLRRTVMLMAVLAPCRATEPYGQDRLQA